MLTNPAAVPAYRPPTSTIVAQLAPCAKSPVARGFAGAPSNESELRGVHARMAFGRFPKPPEEPNAPERPEEAGGPKRKPPSRHVGQPGQQHTLAHRPLKPLGSEGSEHRPE